MNESSESGGFKTMAIHKRIVSCFGFTISLLLVSFIFAPNIAINAEAGSPSIEPTLDTTRESFSLNNLANPSAGLRYRLVPGQSKFIVRAFVGGLLSSFGHDHTIGIKDFSGDAEITPDAVAPASLQMTIKAESLAVLDKVSASDKQEIETKMRNEVLEVGQHPNITFKSTSISANKTAEGQYDVQIWGDVTLHGVSKSIWFKSVMTLSGNTLKAKGDFALRQSEFKIKPVSAAGGTIKVKDELKFSFDIVAVK
jgi:polyisoprenoid-binding protein YceI